MIIKNPLPSHDDGYHIGSASRNGISGLSGINSTREAPHIVKKAASANIRNSHDAVASWGNSTWTVRKTITLTNGLIGAARFLFDLKNIGSLQTVHGQIRRNGAVLGADQTTTSGTYVTKSEDITQTWNPGDLCQLYLRDEDGVETVFCQNFRIAYDDSPTVTVDSTNS